MRLIPARARSTAHPPLRAAEVAIKRTTSVERARFTTKALLRLATEAVTIGSRPLCNGNVSHSRHHLRQRESGELSPPCLYQSDYRGVRLSTVSQR
ncbi:hypothetical protein HRbin36_01418 [bacterium HR36]|nr:hypothetical protein HRbin36_01418 [bacterium HR36]